MESATEQFVAFTGASADEAANYLEAAGGNLEMAVQLFFSAMAGDAPMEDVVVGSGTDWGSADAAPLPDWYTVVWGQTRDIPEAWTLQTLDFVSLDQLKTIESAFTGFGMLQPKNGPCGLLAAIQAVLLAKCSKKTDFGPEYKPSTNDLAEALATLIASSSADDRCQVMTWKKPVGSASIGSPESVDSVEVTSSAELLAFILEHIADFKAPGGLLLIAYSAVLTHSPEKVMSELTSTGGQPPLIYGQFSLCTSELMSLLLRGTADGNVGAYGSVGGTKVDWPASTPCGMLSNMEVEHGVPICDRLKTPDAPVWILHGRDHFTVAFIHPIEALPQFEANDQDQDESTVSRNFTLWQFNGLPPNGPRMAKLSLSATSIAPPAPDDHKKGVATFHTPIVGQIYDVVQALPADKKDRPKGWSTWSYEVVMSVPDESGALYGKGEPYKPGCEPKVFEQGQETLGQWRCATCYVKRHETFAFKLNDEGAETCQHCGKKRSDVGWSLWMHYNDLPKSWQASMDRRYQPDIATLLGTKWKNLQVQYDDADNPPSV